MKIAILADNDTIHSEAKELAEALQESEHQIEFVNVDEQALATLRAIHPEICCIASGTKGSHGALQELCELIHVPYLGSQPEACKLCTDERLSMFAVLRYAEASEEEVTVSPLVNFTLSAELLKADCETLACVCEERIPGGYPFEVKSLRRAASASILVNDREELLATYRENAEFGCKVCQWIEGVRLSVAVLGTGWSAHVLPPVEEVISDGSTEFVSPVRLESLHADERIAQSIRSEIERCAFEACLSLGLRDYALVHLIWDGAQVRFAGIEVAPSMAADSAFVKACRAADLSVEGVLNYLVSL